MCGRRPSTGDGEIPDARTGIVIVYQVGETAPWSEDHGDQAQN